MKDKEELREIIKIWWHGKGALHMEELSQAILSWHNKKVAEAIRKVMSRCDWLQVEQSQRSCQNCIFMLEMGECYLESEVKKYERGNGG